MFYSLSSQLIIEIWPHVLIKVNGVLGTGGIRKTLPNSRTFYVSAHSVTLSETSGVKSFGISVLSKDLLPMLLYFVLT